MNDGAIRFLSVVSGFIGGTSYLLDSVHTDPLLALGIACIKALIIGGFAWMGQTAAKEIILGAKKQITTKWSIFKTKNKPS